MNQNALIVFQKNLVLGKVKTRLAENLGDQKALDIYGHLVDATIKELWPLTGCDIFIYYSDFIEKLSRVVPLNFVGCQQKGNDLGDRMLHAFIDIFDEGYESALIIGTDCPYLKTHILIDAFESLRNHDVVLGPANDGGYYLLGMKKVFPELFCNIPWSTDTVLELSLNTIKAKKLSYELLPHLSDIDTLEDWENYTNSVKKG